MLGSTKARSTEGKNISAIESAGWRILRHRLSSGDHAPVISRDSQVARLAQRRVTAMDCRSAETLREEMIDRLEQVDRRFDETSQTVTQQLVEQRAYSDFGHERVEKALHSLSASIARLERKLDRLLALSVESRTRSR